MQYIDDQVDNPWFIDLSWLRPHPPFLVPEPYNSMYKSVQTEAPIRHLNIAQEQAQHPYLKYEIDAKLAQKPHYGEALLPSINDQDLHQLKTTYYGMMSEVNAQMGRLLGFLTDRKLLDSTLIVFSSDHGEQLGDHYLLRPLREQLTRPHCLVESVFLESNPKDTQFLLNTEQYRPVYWPISIS